MTNPTPHGQVPEALRLADALDLYATGDEHQRDIEDAAAELRRLHYENERLAALVEAQQPAAHVQNPAEIEHVAGDVSKNGPELNMAQQPAPSAACPVDNNNFDHQTAADVLNGKTVSDEAMRKFVAVARWAHDDRVGLRATLLSVRGELASREAEIALLKKALMDAEAPQPSPTPQADSQPAPDAWLVTGIYTKQAFPMHCSAMAFLNGLLSSDPDGGYKIVPLFIHQQTTAGACGCEEPPTNPGDTESGPEGEWYCETHPGQLMGHAGCGGAGIPACGRIPCLMNQLRLTKQQVRETGRMRDEMAAMAHRAARAPAGSVTAPAGGAEEVDKALNDYAQAFMARAMGWTRENGDAMPDARTKLYSAISSYARGLFTTSPHAPGRQPAPEYVGNGMFKGETIKKAAEHWANWCDRRCMTGLSEFLRVVAAHAPADSVREDAARWRDHVGKLDALVAYCPTCCQGFVAKQDMTRDEVLFACGKAVGQSGAKRLREALDLAVGHIDMDALRISHCKDAAAIDAARKQGAKHD